MTLKKKNHLSGMFYESLLLDFLFKWTSQGLVGLNVKKKNVAAEKLTLTSNIKLKPFKHAGCIFFKLLIGHEAVLTECEYHAVQMLFRRHTRLSQQRYQQRG